MCFSLRKTPFSDHFLFLNVSMALAGNLHVWRVHLVHLQMHDTVLQVDHPYLKRNFAVADLYS